MLGVEIPTYSKIFLKEASQFKAITDEELQHTFHTAFIEDSLEFGEVLLGIVFADRASIILASSYGEAFGG